MKDEKMAGHILFGGPESKIAQLSLLISRGWLARSLGQLELVFMTKTFDGSDI